MGNCKSCSAKISFLKAKGPNGDLCDVCYDEYLDVQKSKMEPLETQETEEIRLRELKVGTVLLTTETNPDLNIEERIEIISAECVFGMNIFKDLFAGLRDVFGGRSVAVQNTLRDARKTVLNELKQEAYLIGANAVIAVDLDYSEVSGGGKSMMFLVASGTAVRIENTETGPSFS